MAAVSRLAWGVLVLALLGALTNLFAPQVHVWGMNVGSLGATVFGFTLWIGAWLFAQYPDRIFSPDWSIAERRAWAALVFILLIFLSWLRFMWHLASLPEPPAELDEIPGDHFVWNLTVLLIAWAVVSSTIRGREKDVIEADERDLRLRRSADQVGDWALTIMVIWCVGLLVRQPAGHLTWFLAPLIAANVLIGILIAKSLVEHVYLVARYAWDRR
jgi:hypothetical protein